MAMAASGHRVAATAALGLGTVIIGGVVLLSHKGIKRRLFAVFCNTLTKGENIHPETRKTRRDLCLQAKGNVLELGPGPGTNFAFFKENSEIKSYVGIEPNPHMHKFLHDKAKELGITFPVDVRTIKGESIDVPSASIDTVILTHVLCSVDSPKAVLAEITRVLRPGGTFLFMEHVTSPPNTWRRRIQDAINPVWSFVFDGCRFDETYFRMDELAIERGGKFEVEYKSLELPMPFSIIKPHILGKAIKKAA